MRQEMNCNSERGGGDGREDDGSNARGRGFTDVGQTCPHIEWECGHQQDILAGSVEYSYDMPRTQGSSSLFSRICLFCYREHVLVRMFSLYEIIAKYLCILFYKS